MVISTLRRRTTVTKPEDWSAREERLLARLRPHLERQPGFVSHELRREDDAGSMAADCRAYLRNGAAAMAATMLDAAFPTAPYPNGNWVRETVEQA